MWIFRNLIFLYSFSKIFILSPPPPIHQNRATDRNNYSMLEYGVHCQDIPDDSTGAPSMKSKSHCSRFQTKNFRWISSANVVASRLSDDRCPGSSRGKRHLLTEIDVGGVGSSSNISDPAEKSRKNVS